jgi:hypothetical protein
LEGVVGLNNKKMIAWTVVLAVAGIFLLGLGPLGNFWVFGASGVVGILATIGFFFVAGVAAVVAIYWGRE